MIVSFKHKGLKKLFYDGDESRVSAQYRERIENMLFALDSARTIEAVNMPGYRLHALKGDMAGLWSISISGNWRITFRFSDGDVYDVDMVDYH